MKRIYTLTDSQQPDREWEVHAKRCTHIRRGMRQAIASVISGSTERVVEWWIDDELIEMGWKATDVKVMACTKNAPQAS